MEYTKIPDLYHATCTLGEFMSEWGGGDSSNIPFMFHIGTLWIFQPRKECVYAIYIKSYTEYEKEIKKIVRDGLKELKANYQSLSSFEFSRE